MVGKAEVQKKEGLGHGRDTGRSSVWWPGIAAVPEGDAV